MNESTINMINSIFIQKNCRCLPLQIKTAMNFSRTMLYKIKELNQAMLYSQVIYLIPAFIIMACSLDILAYPQIEFILQDDEESKAKEKQLSQQQVLLGQQIPVQREIQVKEPKNRLKACLVLIFIVLVAMSIGIYFLVQKYIYQQINVTNYLIKRNYSYNTNIEINSSVLKDNSVVYSRSNYFTRFVCIEADQAKVTMLVTVHNVTAYLNNLTEISVYDSFPDIQNKSLVADDRSLQEDQLYIGEGRMMEDLPQQTKDLVDSILCFTFSYNLSSGLVFDINFPAKLEAKFRNSIPKIIDSFMPQVGRALMKRDGVQVYRPGLGNVTEVYNFSQLGEYTVVNKTFQKGNQSSSKNYLYYETAFIRDGVIYNNTVVSTTILSSKSDAGDTVQSNYSVTIRQNLTLTFKDKYELPFKNVTSFLDVFRMIRTNNSANATEFEEQVQKEVRTNSSSGARRLKEVSQQSPNSIKIFDKQYQNKIISLPVFGEKLEGYLNYYLVLEIINVSNRYSAHVKVGALSYLTCGFFDMKLAEIIFQKQTKPVSMKFTLDKVLGVVSKYKDQYETVVNLIRKGANLFNTFKELEGFTTIADLVNTVNNFNQILQKLTNQFSIPKVAAEFISQISKFKSIFQNNILTFVNDKVLVLRDLIDSSQALMKSIEQISKQQFQLVQSLSRKLSQDIDGAFLAVSKFTSLNNSIVSMISPIVDDDFLQKQWQKQSQALKPVINFITHEFDDFTQIANTFASESSKYQTVVETIFTELGGKLDSYLESHLDNLQTTVVSRKQLTESLISDVKQDAGTNLIELNNLLSSMSKVHLNIKQYLFKTITSELLGQSQRLNSLIKSAASTSANQGDVKDEGPFYNQYNARPVYQQYKLKIEQLNNLITDKTASLIFSPQQAQSFFSVILSLQKQIGNIHQSSLKMLDQSKAKLKQMTRILNQYSAVYPYYYQDCCGKGCDSCTSVRMMPKNSRNIFIDSINQLNKLLQILNIFCSRTGQLFKQFQSDIEIYKMQTFVQGAYNGLVQAWNIIHNPITTHHNKIKGLYSSLSSLITGHRTAVKNLLSSSDLLGLAKTIEGLPQQLEELNMAEQGISLLPMQYQNILQTLSSEQFIMKFSIPLKLKVQQINHFISQIQSLPVQSTAPELKSAVSSMAVAFRNTYMFNNIYQPKLQQIKSTNRQLSQILAIVGSISRQSPNYMELWEYDDAFSFLAQNEPIADALYETLTLLKDCDYLLPALTNPGLSQQEVDQLQALFTERLVYSPAYDKLQYYFQESQDSVAKLKSIIASLDFELRIVFVSARQQFNSYLPKIKQHLNSNQQLIQLSSSIYQQFSNIDLDKFSASLLNEQLAKIKLQPQFFQEGLKQIHKSLRFKYFANALANVSRLQLLEYRFVLENSISQTEKSIRNLKDRVKDQFQSQIREFIPFIKKFSFGNLLALKEIFQVLQGFKPQYLLNIQKEFDAVNSVIADLGRLKFKSAFKLPQIAKQLIQKAKLLFNQSINAKVGTVVQKINELKGQLPPEFSEPLQNIMRLGNTVKQSLKVDISQYFVQVEQTIDFIEAKLATIDLQFFDSFQKAIDRSIALKNSVSGKIRKMGEQGKSIGNSFNSLSLLLSFDLGKVVDTLNATLTSIMAIAQSILVQDEKEALAIISLFSKSQYIQKKVDAPFGVLRIVLRNMIAYKDKAMATAKDLAKVAQDAMFQKFKFLKKGEQFAKNIISTVEEAQDENDIILYQRQSKNLLDKLKFDYSVPIPTPFGVVLLAFGFLFYAAIGGLVRLSKFRDISGEIYVRGHIDLYVAMGYGIPRILEFLVALVGRIFNTKLTVALVFENIVPVRYIPALAKDTDMAQLSTSAIKLRCFVNFNPVQLFLQIIIRIIWIEIRIIWIKIRLFFFTIRLPLIIIVITMKDIKFPPILIYSGTETVLPILDKTLVQFALWK